MVAPNERTAGRRPEFAVDVLDAITASPGLTARGISQTLGLNVNAVYNSLRWLEARGEAMRSDEWPAGWYTSAVDMPESSDTDDLDAVADLLDEAMRLPSWEAVPQDVRHKIEHARVQIMRARGEVG
jgi:DNA-binding IclR family transcriptional regulator